jgi:hypothetical protein
MAIRIDVLSSRVNTDVIRTACRNAPELSPAAAIRRARPVWFGLVWSGRQHPLLSDLSLRRTPMLLLTSNRCHRYVLSALLRDFYVLKPAKKTTSSSLAVIRKRVNDSSTVSDAEPTSDD